MKDGARGRDAKGYRVGKDIGTDHAPADGAAGDRSDPVMLGGWVLPDLDYPTFRLSLVAKVMDRLTLRRLSESGEISFAQWRVLSRLATAPQGATVGQIADLAWVDRAEVSRAVAALEARGLAARRENPEDRRKPIIYLTELGRRDYLPLARDRSAFHESLVADLTEEERHTLDRLLAKVAQRLVASLRGADPA